MLKKLLLYILFSFILGGFIFSIQVKAQQNQQNTNQNQEEIATSPASFQGDNFFGESLPFAAEGVTCGVPDTKRNICCDQVNFLNPTKKDVDELIEAAKQCNEAKLNANKCFSTAQGNLLSALLLVGHPNDKNELSDTLNQEVTAFFLKVIISPNGKDRGETLRELREYFYLRAEKIRKLSSAEKMKLRVRTLFVENKCIIDAGPIEGFCFRGFAEFFSGLVGDNASIAQLMAVGSSSDPEKCLYGDAVGEGKDCRCFSNRSIVGLCNDYIQDTTEHKKCAECYQNRGGVWTGLGCMPISVASFVQETLLGWGVSLAGLVAILCIIYSAFILQTSQGNPERIKKAREYMTNCIIGLLLIIFSIFILRLIGVNILRLPGFGI